MTQSRSAGANAAGFAFGLSLSLLPAFGPFLAAVLVVSQSWRLRRTDVPWLIATGLFGLSWWASGTWWDGLLGIATVLGPWIVFRTFRDLGHRSDTSGLPRSLVTGLLIGLVSVAVAGLVQAIGGVHLERSSSLVGAVTWQGSPAIFGHGMLVLGGAIAIATAGLRRVPWIALSIALSAILVSGSLGAAIAWTVLVASMLILDRSRGIVRRVVTASTLTALVWGFVALAPVIGWGQIGFLFAGTPPTESADNLLVGTELPRGDWWIDHWVHVEPSTATVGAENDPLVAYQVAKKGEETWLRLQQAVALRPGSTYTLSAWIEDAIDPEAVPSLQGWGQGDADGAPLVFIGDLQAGTWDASVSGPGTLLSVGQTPGASGWTRVHATFRVDAAAGPVTWFVGFVPDARSGTGTPGRFAGLMLEEGDVVSPYQPAGAEFGLGFEHARLPMWRAAWDGFTSRPWTGWGDGAFSSYFRQSRPEAERIDLVPHHPHNVVLMIAFGHGLLGLVGLAALLAALVGPSVRRRDAAMLGFFAAVAVLGLFDATLFHGALIYPIAALAGWRSSLGDDRPQVALPATRPIVVRAALASVDLMVVVGALGLARLLNPASFAHGDASLNLVGLFLWPALTWREGLYPGYGMAAPEELRRHVTAWAQATVALLVLDLVTPLGPGLSALGYGVFLATSLVGLPIGRAATKRALAALGSWGREVVVLGAGETGHRVVRALLRTPLDGLHPVGVFDDDPDLAGGAVEGVPILGPLDEAGRYARSHQVRHVIVAISRLPAARRAHVLTRDRMPFSVVQYVPRLDSLPSYDVVAKELDGLMALESKVGLASGLNRTIKRTFDVIAVVAGGILVSPVLAGLALAVRLDSPGPVLYRQTRIGRHGARFSAWKFRSMREDADKVLTSYLDSHPELRAEWQATHKLKDDPRVTRVGAFLRATSLDELPQIWNVLRGEMSLVGPRPIVDDEIVKYGDVFELYTLVRPGITGHWQVSGRSDTSYDERVEMDAHYIRNWSVWLDLVILVRTVGVVLRREGAY
mgnify:CR=1 FL=1